MKNTLFDNLQKLYRRSLAELSFIALWNFYFLLKLYLSFKGAIELDIMLNLLFLFMIMLPAPQAISKYRTFRFTRTVLSVVLAMLLLWHESWLPPILYSVSFIKEQGVPSFEYIVSFMRGFFSIPLMAASLTALFISLLARKYKRVSIVLLPLLIVAAPFIPRDLTGPHNTYEKVQVPPAEAAEVTNPAKYLESYYSTEAERVVMFRQPDHATPPFDIIILNVCSLSWDDLREIGMSQEDPFFKQFDYLFTDFNSATGYSGPAVMRLLEANCGQKNHNEMQKKDLPKICLLFDSLASVGYEPYVSMDHDGKYGDFLKAVKKLVPHNTVMQLPSGQPDAVFFDKSPLYNDYAMLKKWFDSRQASRAEKTVLYYNTVLLHAGSHWADEKKWYARDTRDQYKDVSSVLLKDIKKFIDLLKSSKRNTVLVFVPEHGRALTGSSFQPPDLRDIPLPKITKVPVGVKFIGPKFNDAKVHQHIISKPTSYFALSWLLSKFVENSPFGNTAASPEDIVFRIPKTDYVSEHEGRVIIEMGGNYIYYGKDKKWMPLKADQLK
ncbi:MAG: cellulose biosynthesis protein BcsG [Nitrospirae bacterium]|nr:cellulose biosynthesis protein BcsG [Nitrospirota bacterium]